MKKTLLILASMISIVFIIFACTNKEINLITNVELDFEQSNTDTGFVKELLPTTLTITPETFLPEFNYFFAYEILEGEGTYLNSEGVRLPPEEPITDIPVIWTATSPLSTAEETQWKTSWRLSPRSDLLF